MLLDTCVLIDVLRGDPAATAFVGALDCKPSASVASATEIFAGLRSQREELAVRRLFSRLTLLEVSLDVSEWAGILLRHYRASHALDFADALIAATAEHHGLPLATLNVKHFPMLKKLRRAY